MSEPARGTWCKHDVGPIKKHVRARMWSEGRKKRQIVYRTRRQMRKYVQGGLISMLCLAVIGYMATRAYYQYSHHNNEDIDTFSDVNYLQQQQPPSFRMSRQLDASPAVMPNITTICDINEPNLAIRLAKMRSTANTVNELLENDTDACFADVTDYSSYPTPLVDPCYNGGWIVYVIGLIYMFIGLAVVCDEYFVPALEQIAERWDLSDDVAGATVMAAGGSAPELFTSVMGTFASKSNVGFGTVVGSAVFNVLFVIGMCAVFSKTTLELTWFPLARDCSFYTLSLVSLAIVYGVITPNEINAGESFFLLFLYGCYVFLMKNNARLFAFASRITGKTPKVSPEGSGGPGASSGRKYSVDGYQYGFNRHSKFRAGVLHLMYNSYSDDQLLERARVHVVAEIQGNVKDTFKAIDLDGDGFIDAKELGNMLGKLLKQVPDADTLERALSAMGGSTEEGGVKITLQDFSAWYATSAARVSADIRAHFDRLDRDKDGKLNRDEVRACIEEMHNYVSPSEGTVDDVMAELDCPSGDAVDFVQFEAWYKKSMLWQQTAERMREEDIENGVMAVTDEDENGPYELEWPDNTRGRIFFILTLPVVLLLYCTIPDVRNEKYSKLYPLSWSLAILWIAIFSYFMVWWAMILGDVIQVPPAIMGLTFLAAGTSIPDMLTSIIVARQGLGDMAVSSSIGSNIFDILIGLPVPWTLYALIYGEPNKVNGNNLLYSVLILVGMLCAAICTIAASGWKMTRTLGFIFFMLYVAFIAGELIRANLLC